MQQLRDEYNEDVDLMKLAADLHLDAIVDPVDLRNELAVRFARARRREPIAQKRKRVSPV